MKITGGAIYATFVCIGILSLYAWAVVDIWQRHGWVSGIIFAVILILVTAIVVPDY